MSTGEPRFRSVVLDVDSTLSGVEGIDWLAACRGDEVARAVSEMTRAAMQGGLPLESVYARRLAKIRPRHDEIEALSHVYVERVALGAPQAIHRLQRAGVQVHLVSGGLRPALLRLVYHVGLSPGDLHAVPIHFDAIGAYVDFDAASPLTTSSGKRDVVRDLALDAPVLAVGDGMTDVAMRESVDCFAAYTGFARRQSVVDAADEVVASFAEVERLVLG
ncbi:MAG: HAD-IB family phosphatase [Gemmatimonadales bacterium]